MDRLALELVGLLRGIARGAGARHVAVGPEQARGDAGASRSNRLENLNLQGALSMKSGDVRHRPARCKGWFSRIKHDSRKTCGGDGQQDFPPRVAEPLKSQLLALAAEIKTVVEQVERNTPRINASVSDTVVKGLAKGLESRHRLGAARGPVHAERPQGRAAWHSSAGDHGVKKRLT